MILNRSKQRQSRYYRKLFAAIVFLCSCLTGFSQPSNPVTNSSVAQKFYCVDARNLDHPAKLLLESLQALANSNAPVLFMIHRPGDLSWRDAMEKQLGTTCEMISADDALARFGANAPQVVWSWSYGWSLSIATTLAGVDHALLTDHKLRGHEIAYDFHNNQLTNKVEAYRWALNEILPKCDQHQLIYLDEVLSWLRDYAMQQKLFVLNLDPLNDPQDIGVLNEILAKFPAQTRVFGWATGAFAKKEKGQGGVTVEDALVSRLSNRGMMLIPADFAANLSFYDQTTPYIRKLTQQRLHRDIQFQIGKRYVLLVNSDGDNVQYDLGGLREQWKMFQKERPNLPKIPVAWTISPSLADVAPVVLQTYFQEAVAGGGLDEFVAGPSGYAYVNPGSIPGAQLRQFVQLTRQACDKADLRSIVILDNSARPPAQVANFISAYADANFDALWLAGMPRYVGAMKQTAFVCERIRVGDKDGKEVAKEINAQEIKQNGIDFPFLLIYGTFTSRLIRELGEGLDSSCVVVSPTEMADLIRQWYASTRNAGR